MSMQRIVIIGNLGKDPETRYLTNGNAVTNFSVACTEKWKGKDGEQQEHTEWFRCNAFERTAEIAGEYLRKGHQVCVEGKLRTRKYEKDGEEHQITELVVDRLHLLYNRDGGDSEGSGRSSGGSSGSGRGNARPNDRDRNSGRSGSSGGNSGKPAGGGKPKNDEDFDDDIPF